MTMRPTQTAAQWHSPYQEVSYKKEERDELSFEGGKMPMNHPKIKERGYEGIDDDRHSISLDIFVETATP